MEWQRGLSNQEFYEMRLVLGDCLLLAESGRRSLKTRLVGTVGPAHSWWLSPHTGMEAVWCHLSSEQEKKCGKRTREEMRPSEIPGLDRQTDPVLPVRAQC